MQRYIGLDVHAASCTLAVISQAGKRLKDFPVETNGQALVEAIRMIPGRKHLALEEGLQSAWLYETLSRHVDEIVVDSYDWKGKKFTVVECPEHCKKFDIHGTAWFVDEGGDFSFIRPENYKVIETHKKGT